MGSWNIIGFNRYSIDTKEYRHCSVHPYKRLIPHKTDENLLICPSCGSEFPLHIKDTVAEQNIQSKFGVSNKTMIVSAKKKRKHYDSFGNLIPDNDPIIIKDLQGGKRVVYYHEQKVEGDKEFYVAK